MRNYEILPSTVLDIIFEDRNKAYGAYALRKGYNNRMLTALVSGMALIFVVIFLSTMNTAKNMLGVNENSENGGIIVKTVEIPKVDPPKPKEINQPPVQKLPDQTAAVKYISAIKIETDVTTTMASIDEMDGKLIGDKNVEGKQAEGIVGQTADPIQTKGNEMALPAEEKVTEFKIQERNPEFPGGEAALRKFLAKNLGTPTNLEAGEMKTVKVRFKVDTDGTVNSFEVIVSGGNEFDREVVRVCKRMPKWVPALQNGINVSVNYILPVTFVGEE